MSLPSGNGPTTKANSMCVTFATDEGAVKSIGPTNGGVSVLPVTASSVHLDLTGEEIYPAIGLGQSLTLKADGGDVWYRWSPNTGLDVVDENATSGANQAFVIFAGERSDETAPTGTRGIVVKGSAICKLRVIASG